YRTTPELFTKKAQALVDKYTVRTETADKTPVVAPPPGSDVYLVARLWNYWPILELEKDKTYRLHITSMDYNHGFSLQPVNINIQIVPGYEHVVTVTPNKAGTYSLLCNEFCGINHHTMVSRLYVK
ncbi:MAG: cytochrome C oxidase subunit II, partial [Betaproteobacteria bacterium]